MCAGLASLRQHRGASSRQWTFSGVFLWKL